MVSSFAPQAPIDDPPFYPLHILAHTCNCIMWLNIVEPKFIKKTKRLNSVHDAGLPEFDYSIFETYKARWFVVFDSLICIKRNRSSLWPARGWNSNYSVHSRRWIMWAHQTRTLWILRYAAWPDSEGHLLYFNNKKELQRKKKESRKARTHAVSFGALALT